MFVKCKFSFFFDFDFLSIWLFSDELDSHCGFITCEAKDDDAGLPFTELELIPVAFWLWTDLECEAFPTNRSDI